VAVNGEELSTAVIATAGPGGGLAGPPSRVQATTPTAIRATNTTAAAVLSNRARTVLAFLRCPSNDVKDVTGTVPREDVAKSRSDAPGCPIGSPAVRVGSS